MMMDFSKLAEDLPGRGAFAGAGSWGDVVVSSRVRLARNLAGRVFTHRASPAQRLEMLEVCHGPLLDALAAGRAAAPPTWLRVDSAAADDKQLMLEANLISRDMARRDMAVPRAVCVAADGQRSAMANEEDHLRLQAVHPGLALAEAFAEVDALDSELAQKLEFAWSRRFGFLTACPTNVGTGLRAGVLLHLPALAATREIEKVKHMVRDLGLALRGLHGEGTEPVGDLYQLSNQVTLGRSEREMLADFADGIVPQVVAYERQARMALAKHRQLWLEDQTLRAWGTLTQARLLSTGEAMALLSHLRLGARAGIASEIPDARLARLMFVVQPAHLQKCLGQAMAPAQRRQARASLVREVLERGEGKHLGV